MNRIGIDAGMIDIILNDNFLVIVNSMTINILICSENFYFRFGMSRMIEHIFDDQCNVCLTYDRKNIHNVEYIFVDSASKEILTCLSALRKKRKDAFLFIICNHSFTKFDYYIPPCYFNTLIVNKCHSVVDVLKEIRGLFDLERDSVCGRDRSLCRECIFVRRISQQQRKVAEYIISGLDCKIIAKKMNISYKTVQTHKCRLMKKCRVKTKYELCHLLKYISGEEGVEVSELNKLKVMF